MLKTKTKQNQPKPQQSQRTYRTHKPICPQRSVTLSTLHMVFSRCFHDCAWVNQYKYLQVKVKPLRKHSLDLDTTILQQYHYTPPLLPHPSIKCTLNAHTLLFCEHSHLCGHPRMTLGSVFRTDWVESACPVESHSSLSIQRSVTSKGSCATAFKNRHQNVNTSQSVASPSKKTKGIS